MIEVKNQFARNILFWVLLLPFIFMLVAPSLMQADAMKVPAQEVQTLKTLGRDTQAVTASANRVFTDLFVTTGIVQATYKMFKSPLRPASDPKSVQSAASFSSRYVEGFWHLIYRAIWRVMGLWPVLSVLLLAVVLPATIDGLAIRGRKLDQFKPHNPVFFWASAHSAISVAGMFMILPLLPLPISVMMLYGAVGLIALSMWTTASNLQTGN